MKKLKPIKFCNQFSPDLYICRDGTPLPKRFYKNAIKLHKAIVRVRKELGGASLYLNSTYRHPDYNKEVKGGKRSLHLTCMAADLDFRSIPEAKVFRTIKRLQDKKIITMGGAGLYDTFVHIDVRGKRARWLAGKAKRAAIRRRKRRLKTK